MKSSTKKSAKPAGNQTPAVMTMPRRGTAEYRNMQRAEFDKRFEAQKKSRQA